MDGLALWEESKIFNVNYLCYCKAIMHFGKVNILWSHSGHLIGLPCSIHCTWNGCNIFAPLNSCWRSAPARSSYFNVWPAALFANSSLHRITADAPSENGQQSSNFSGEATTGDFSTSSTVIFLWTCAFGFINPFSWFLTATLARSSSVALWVVM